MMIASVAVLVGCGRSPRREPPPPEPPTPEQAQKQAEALAAERLAEQERMREAHGHEAVFAGNYTVARPRRGQAGRMDRLIGIRVEAGERPCAVYWQKGFNPNSPTWEFKPGCSIDGDILAWPAMSASGPPALIRKRGSRFQLCRAGEHEPREWTDTTAANGEWVAVADECIRLRREPLED